VQPDPGPNVRITGNEKPATSEDARVFFGYNQPQPNATMTTLFIYAVISFAGCLTMAGLDLIQPSRKN